MIRLVDNIEQKIDRACNKKRVAFSRHLVLMLPVSLFYTICSQIIIPMPFNLVPLSIQPMPVFVCAYLFGWPAVSAYGLYLLQGALGAPVFAGLLGGVARLLGPTGGYLVGFGLGAMVVVFGKKYTTQSLLKNSVLYMIATVITFSAGIAQLSWFIPAKQLLLCGFYPFLIGDFLIKPLLFLGVLFFVIKKKGVIDTLHGKYVCKKIK